MLFDNLVGGPTMEGIGAFADNDTTLSAPLVESNQVVEGIAFAVPEGFSRRECFILRQALYALADTNDPTNADLDFIFRHNEQRIHQVARRLMSSINPNTRVVIGPSSLRKN